MLLHSIAVTKQSGGKSVGLYPKKNPKEASAIFYFESPLIDLDRRDTDAQKKLLVKEFAGVGWEAARLLESVWTAPDFYFDRVMQVQMKSWSRGRVALLGDAAHCASPLAGNGTSMALVGAYLLAGEIAQTPDDYQGAFARYEVQMREYVTRCQTFAYEGVSGLMPRSELRLWLRNFGIRMLPYMPWRGLFFRDLHRVANLVKLKDYPSAKAKIMSEVAA